MKYLSSKKLAIVLMMAITMLGIAGLTVPRVFESLWTKVIFALFFVNLLSCTILRIRSLLTERRNFPGQKYKEIFLQPGVNVESLVRYLARHRFKTVMEADEGGNRLIQGEKNGFARWSAVILHVGLLVITLGILITAMGRIDGIIPLMEGQQVTDKQENYVSLTRGIFSPEHTGLPVKMKKIAVDYDRRSKIVNSVTSVFDFGSESLQIDKQMSIESHGLTIYPDQFGYTMIAVISDPKGREIEFTFPLLEHQKENYLYENRVNIPETPYSVSVVLYPNAIRDAANSEEAYVTKGNALLNPVISATIEDSRDTEVSSSYLTEGTRLKFDNFELCFKDTGTWVSLRLVKDPGAPAVYLGFVIGTVGLLMLYLIVPKRIYIKIKGGSSVEIGGRMLNKHLFPDELEKLCGYIISGGDRP